MVNFKLEVKVEMENVKEIRMPEQICMTVQQAGGNETRGPVFISKNETHELDNGRSTCNFKLRWEGSKKESYVNIVEDKSVKDSYAETDNDFVTVAIFECRGLEPISWHHGSGFAVEAAQSGTVFENVDLTEGDWYEYDDNGDQSDSHREESNKSEDGQYGRDPNCSYHTQIEKQCNLQQDSENPNERKMVCKTLKRLFRKCPGQPMEEVERTEIEGDTPGMDDKSQNFGLFNEFHEGMKEFDLLDPHMLVNPAQIFEKFFGIRDPFGDFFQGDFGGFEQAPSHIPREYQPDPKGGYFNRYNPPHRKRNHEDDDEKHNMRREAQYETNEL